MFEALPSQLQYPEIIERANSNQVTSPAQTNEAGIMSATWYPPLKQTLALLSLLYGTVSAPIFEDMARRSITLCLQALAIGATGVRRYSSIFLRLPSSLPHASISSPVLWEQMEESTSWRSVPHSASAHPPRAVDSLQHEPAIHREEAGFHFHWHSSHIFCKQLYESPPL
jgi:hypothetical protein